MDYNAWNKEIKNKYAHGEGRTGVFWSFLFLTRYVTSAPRCYILFKRLYEYLYVYIFSRLNFSGL